MDHSQSVKVGDAIVAPASKRGGDPTAADPTIAEPTEKHWYGGAILLTDGIAYGSIGLGFGIREAGKAAWPIGVLTYELGGPIVHLAHGNWGRSAISAGLRVALPVLGLVIGASACERGGDSRSGAGGFCDGAVLGGIFTGMAVTTIVDAALVAYEPASETPTVAPLISVGSGHAFVGATGAF